MHCPFLNLLGWGGSSYNFPNAFCKRGRSLPAPSAPDIRKWWKRQCWNSRFHHSYANVKMWVKVIQSKQLACIIDRDATAEKLMALSRYESFSDVGEIRVWFASKILTPCRTHWNAFLIAQIIAKCHSFPNMYGMLLAKVDRLAGKTYFVQKNT